MAAVFGVVMAFLMAIHDESLPGLEAVSRGVLCDPSRIHPGALCARETRWSRHTTSHVTRRATVPYGMPYNRETYKRDGRREGSYLDEEERLDLEGSANESTTISIATITVANAIRGRTRVGTHTT